MGNSSSRCRAVAASPRIYGQGATGNAQGMYIRAVTWRQLFSHSSIAGGSTSSHLPCSTLQHHISPTMSETNGASNPELKQQAEYSSGAAVSRFITPGGNPLDTSQPAFPVFHRKFGNPAPLGLLSFGGTTLVLSFFNYQVRGITHPNVIVGLALALGGVAQMISGIEEWATGNTFGGSAFTIYGAFWLSFGYIFVPSSGILKAYENDPHQLQSALGIYLVMWGILTFIFLIATHRSSVALVVVFFLLDVTFWVLAAGHLTEKLNVTKAGGILGILTAFAAFYTALAGLLTKDTSYFLLPVGDLSGN
ncbi:Ammonia transport outward protein 2 [Vanrija pseudolonga]|uniref:Ammonia transport outward protein 2 n=1 Tax=Vanrija pseudolonga TaxID=143232 RepID=A0AAF0YB58_9TREE|nr:Ammonia transport outward protein 2 [Vanrija pseudolonga]